MVFRKSIFIEEILETYKPPEVRIQVHSYTDQMYNNIGVLDAKEYIYLSPLTSKTTISISMLY